MTFDSFTTTPPSRARAETSVSTPAALTRAEPAGAVARPVVPPQRQPVITSSRPPRFVDYMACPMCAYRVGIEFHGVLMSGAKVHTIGVHSPGRGNRRNSEPRCMGAALRVEFVGDWRGVKS